MGRNVQGGAGSQLAAPTGNSFVQVATVTLNLAALNALGAVLTSTVNVGAVLPAKARVLNAEVNTTTALAGTGLLSALATLQGGSDSVGTMSASTSVAAIGFGLVGTNPYCSRGGQQVKLTITLTGINLSALTAGTITASAWYAVL